MVDYKVVKNRWFDARIIRAFILATSLIPVQAMARPASEAGEACPAAQMEVLERIVNSVERTIPICTEEGGRNDAFFNQVLARLAMNGSGSAGCIPTWLRRFFGGRPPCPSGAGRAAREAVEKVGRNGTGGPISLPPPPPPPVIPGPRVRMIDGELVEEPKLPAGFPPQSQPPVRPPTSGGGGPRVPQNGPQPGDPGWDEMVRKALEDGFLDNGDR